MASLPDRPSGDLPWRAAISSPGTPTVETTRIPGAEAPDDREIARAVLDGQREAFRVLVERESAAVIRACYRVLGDHGEAEDVAQEAFVTAYRSLATWRGDGPLGAWLTRIAIRLAVRRSARRRAVSWASPMGVFDGQGREVGLTPSPEPEREALRAEQAAATRRAVAALGEPYREVVALRFFGDRTLEEIAVLTGRPLGTVKTHLRRGLLRLRDQLMDGVA